MFFFRIALRLFLPSRLDGARQPFSPRPFWGSLLLILVPLCHVLFLFLWPFAAVCPPLFFLGFCSLGRAVIAGGISRDRQRQARHCVGLSTLFFAFVDGLEGQRGDRWGRGVRGAKPRAGTGAHPPASRRLNTQDRKPQEKRRNGSNRPTRTHSRRRPQRQRHARRASTREEKTREKEKEREKKRRVPKKGGTR